MCGRNSLFPPARVLEQRFDAELVIPDYTPRYNIAPGQAHPAISNEATEIDSFHWGLVPGWMDPDEDGFINARAETAHEKPAFRSAWAERPCVVLSSGFYEWQDKARGGKQPYRIYRPDEPAFALAGLWEPANADNASITILTTEPNDLVAPIHDRMPVVLRREDELAWLGGSPEERRKLCRPYPDDDLDAYPISRRVNNPEYDEADLIEPVEDPQTGLGEFG